MENTYAKKIRRQLHMYPEIGFDLDNTIELLRKELADIGVIYTEEYGKSCIVATINPEKNHYTIGIRADMDALPIAEENDVEYKSKIDGKMHACGHDAHTAIALATLKELYEERAKINCAVKFLFQSGEETYCGAKYMADDGVMNDIDCIIALHVEPKCPVGKILLNSGPRNADAEHFSLDFYGKSVHAAFQQNGIDANMVAMKAYSAIEMMIAKQVSPHDVVVFNAGEIHGGTANNIISDYCSMKCTLRTWNNLCKKMIMENIIKISELTAKMYSAKFEYISSNHYPVLSNDKKITKKLEISAEKVIGSENILLDDVRSMGAEDFSYFTNKKPGCMFKLGVSNEAKRKTYGLHSHKFDIDEDAMDIGIKIFKQFVYDNMNNE